MMKMKFSTAIFAYVTLGAAILFFNTEGFAIKLYSYQSGNWNGSNVWTTDSTGTTLTGSATPGNSDIVCVLTGRTITATGTIASTGLTITINIGAVLNLADKTVTNPIILNGKGRIRTSRVSSTPFFALLPTITGGTFLTLNGGTVEYYAASGNFSIDGNVATYCNLVINLGLVTQIMTISRNLNIYGSLTIQKGILQINNTSTTKRIITVGGNLTVEASGKITTGSGNTNTAAYSIAKYTTTNNTLPPTGQFHTIFHQLTVGGDFTNNGTVRFTNLTAPNYGEFAGNGAVTVRFTGEANNIVTLNGVTDFYNLIVDKGSDQTYILTLFSSNVTNFALYGSNAVRRDQNTPFTQDNPEVRKALWLKNGTLKLTGNILIPSLSEGPVGPAGNGDYAIGLAAQLWIAGHNVSVYTTASDSSGFPQAPAHSAGVTTNAEQALSIFGTFRISDGYFSTRHSSGIIFWNTANSSSMVVVDGGVVNATVMRSTGTAAGKTSYVQTGGTVIIRGNETEPGELSSVPIFNIPNPSSTFVMTGGEIIIRDRNNGSDTTGNGVFLNCDPGNFSVTGGKITFETNPVNSPSTDIYSKVNLWNLDVKRKDTTGTTGVPIVNLLHDLIVSNKITIYVNARLSAGTGNFPVTVSNDFFINQGGTYTPNNNTTAMTGYGNHFLWNDGTITNGLYNLEVSKPLGSMILASAASSFTIRNDLTITTGTLADGGKTVYVSGNVINSAIHVGAGKISLNKSSGTQVISGNGLGVFQNLELNNTNGLSGTAQVSLAADIGITGVLTLANDRLFDIARYQLTLTGLASIVGGMSASRFILTSGAPSDGGLRRIYVDTTTYIFPVGSGSNYTPVTIHLKKKPATFGSVTVKPVPLQHPFVTNSTCLQNYWKVEQAGFTNIQANSISLLFNYGSLPDNPLYVPGKYNPAFWTYVNDVALVDETANLISFPSENSFTGDYTAGISAAFGSVTAFYSRSNGEWSAPSTWSNVDYGGATAATAPGANNPVFIGNASGYNHTVAVSTGSVFCGSLSIKSGSTLDIGSTTGHNFGTVLPGSLGKLRISSTGATAVFPAGDFGNFLGASGGTVEYYTGSVDFLLPLISALPTIRAITNYCNVALSPATGFTITMPNVDLVVYGSMTVSGSSATGFVKLNGVAARSLTIKTDLLINKGNLVFQNGNAQSIRIDKNLTIAAGAIFNLAATGAVVSHKLSLGGNVTNNGTLDLSAMVTPNLYKCDVTFTGTLAASISGRGTTNDFYSLTLDKGASSTPTLTITSTAFTFSNNTAPLTLLNGTFRLSTSALSVTVASEKFTIPATTCLSANGGFILVATAADDDADVILSGMIEVKSGGIFIGNSADSINNDIEYSGAGYPTIEISGGSLFVNGQVRRSMINGLGSLVYKQSGSSAVTINGRKSQPTRAKLEILNSGSVFDMSGGALNIVRGGSITYNDLYLRPEYSTITGGTIVFGSAVTEGTGNLNSFTLDSQSPLFNLTVDGVTRPKTLTLSVHGISLKGSLTVQPTSVFNADSLDVNIAGNLVNLNTDAGSGVTTGGYRVGSLRQETTFNGADPTQSITGVAGNTTNFAKLIINNTNLTGTVTLDAGAAVRVNKDLTLTGGVLNDGGNIVTVIGNITNSSVHTGTGRILLAGSSVQTLSGNGFGKFGNLYLNSAYDVSMIVTMDITGVLTFQGRMLDIGNNLLILSNTADGSIVGNSATSYIRTDGLISDAGVRKSFPAAAHDFTFPVGCPQKYTPARINVTANSAPGTITMVPVNSKHFCTTDPGDFQLKYYWHVTSAGFSGTTASHYYTYLLSDVAGAESSYIGGRFYNNQWIQGTAVSTSLHQFSFPDVTYLDGDYTAGYPSEFLTILTYFSRNATLGGAWDNLNTWSTVSHAGAAATTYPNGQVVVIAPGHTVTANGTGRRAYTLTLNGTAILDLANFVGHDLGTVTGTGTIKLTPSDYGFFVFPAGNFLLFTLVSGGAIELYNASANPVVFPYPQTYNRLILSGSGIKLMTDVDIMLNGSLSNLSGSSFTASSIGKLILNGNWINDGTFTHNNGTTIFNGTTVLSGAVPLTLNHIQINTGCGLTCPTSGAFNIAGDWFNNGSFNHNSGTVNFAGITTLSGNSTTTFNNIQIGSGKTFTGKGSADFIVRGNWINNGTFNNNGGGVVFDSVSVISGSQITGFGNVTINSNRNLTGPAAGTISVSMNFTNNGIFNHNGGTIIFNGEVQDIGGSSSTLFNNITIETGSNTSITALNQKLRGILLSNGNLSVNKKLTLLSDQTQTALIDGTGTGEVTGDLIMQRYLPVGYGYKYFSSPFQSTNVGQFSDHVNLTASFPTFYRYDENRFFTGWLNYTNSAGILNPMQGFAVNFGSTTPPDTVDLFGVVNNRSMIPLTLFNSARPFTLGFNLIGNPYPSPIDWNASTGWVRTNIDNAVYYFNAGTTDQYTGTYSSYVNGVSSDGLAGRIIAAMQGFFIHVSNGTFPVQSTLIFTNGVRVNNLSPRFHKKESHEWLPLLRIRARNCVDGSSGDPTVIYFNNEATMTFDNQLDALKLMNTDILEPNLYSLSTDSEKLSVNGMPYPTDSITEVNLGLNTLQEGFVSFRVDAVEEMPVNLYIYFCDRKTGIKQNISLHPDYQIFLQPGTSEDRFSIIFSMKDLRHQPQNGDPFYIYSFRNRLFIYSKSDSGRQADLVIYNLLGQRLFRKTLTVEGYQEMDLNYPTGIYVVCLSMGDAILNRKVYINNQW
ncbi:MAG: hypothetical protein NT004_13910 [Bacteroidetes bacterium]|nr:hypothetical protein [Bacteroidota bacterium]